LDLDPTENGIQNAKHQKGEANFLGSNVLLTLKRQDCIVLGIP
jgi:hypothetical protein